jgi:hypothetical protein
MGAFPPTAVIVVETDDDGMHASIGTSTHADGAAMATAGAELRHAQHTDLMASPWITLPLGQTCSSPPCRAVDAWAMLYLG